MSNKAVSGTYRTIIDDVIANVRQDFEEMGIEKEVLEELQRSWEAKVVATGVAEFDGAEPVPPRQRSKGKAQEAVASTSSSSAGPSSKVARVNGADVGSSRDAAGSAGQGDADVKAKSGSASNGDDGADDDKKAGEKRKRPVADDDAIGSDLDDSEEDEDEGIDDGDMDGLILCLYEKVQRVRNRWRVLLRDGVISLNGRDYLFGKLSGELEW